MSAKRVANTDLNHDNWNQDEESEEAGEFKKASDDVLKNRVRKVAKRRMPDSTDGTPTSNPFQGFGGFQKSSISSTSTTSSPFSFLSKITQPETKTNGETKEKSIFGLSTPKSTTNNNNDNSEYYSKVKALNQAFLDWIKSNIEDAKGLCDLTPVFKDYEKHMKECEGLKTSSKKAITPTEKEPAAKSTVFGQFPAASPLLPNTNSPSSGGIFSSKPTTGIFSSKPETTKETSPAKTAESKPFSFGLGPTNSTLSSAPSFSFGLQKTSTGIGPTPPLPFGNITNISATPFTFSSNVTQSSVTTENQQGTDDQEAQDEEPPKNEFVPVVEEDSLYSKRCKVFVKSGADYADRGIGTLFLKKVDDKVQLIVRADTNLGNILLNIIICDGLPTSRLGKNNVMIVCVPTPECKPPPIPVLVRVKTADEADELLSTLEKYKSA